MHLMSNLNQIPGNFQVLSTYPQLRIKEKMGYRNPLISSEFSSTGSEKTGCRKCDAT
jgi:hypothetical protein